MDKSKNLLLAYLVVAMWELSLYIRTYVTALSGTAHTVVFYT